MPSQTTTPTSTRFPSAPLSQCAAPLPRAPSSSHPPTAIVSPFATMPPQPKPLYASRSSRQRCGDVCSATTICEV
ncbi:hypothetical protein FIBSPDRAFT_878318, partial [Athelia psychrophila]